MKSPFYKFTGFEANIQPDSKNNEDFYNIKYNIQCSEFTLRDYAYYFIAEHVMYELRQYENPAAYVFVKVDSVFPEWNNDVLFARIWFDVSGVPHAQLLCQLEDI